MLFLFLVIGLAYDSGDGFRIDDNHEEPVWLPAAVLVHAGEVYVADNEEARIKVYDMKSGGFLRGFGQKGQGPGEFQSISAMTWRQGELLVLDTQRGAVSRFKPDGEFIDMASGFRTFTGLFRGDTVVLHSPMTEHLFQVFGFDGTEKIAFHKKETKGETFDPKTFSKIMRNMAVIGNQLVTLTRAGLKLEIFDLETGKLQSSVNLNLFERFGREAAVKEIEPGVFSLVGGSPVRDMVRSGDNLLLFVRNEQGEDNPHFLIKMNLTGKIIAQKKLPFHASALFLGPDNTVFFFDGDESVFFQKSLAALGF